MLTVIAPSGGLTERVARFVQAQSTMVMPSAIIDALPVARAASLGDLSDLDVDAGCVAPLADLAATLSGLVPDHRRIVLISTTVGLGDWDAAVSGAFVAGATGLMRSIVLEYMSQDIVINMIAAPSPDGIHAANVAALAGALLGSGGVNGQIIACDGGENLRMRQARRRLTR